ncbi:hypothetical protein QA612_21105 [Evansella sp. AB-P1]|nr:hypothetical protein [Evansella sp. AB-P1]MDG5789958.1 hypothetical protein [Evansella sp. AB-P1]
MLPQTEKKKVCGKIEAANVTANREKEGLREDRSCQCYRKQRKRRFAGR